MAEFTEVMRQAQRLCNMEECHKCQLCNFDAGNCMMSLGDYSGEVDMDYAEVENIIMQWAKENPEPVYPSWAETWKQLFPDACGIPCIEYCGRKYRALNCARITCNTCKDRPIPAEIAKKLGVKPKEI